MDEDFEAQSRKRKQRAILSCVTCRKRKLKCDRELPCNRCTNGGIAEKCAYGSEVHFVKEDAGDVLRMKRPRQISGQPLSVSPDRRTQQHSSIAEHQVDTSSSEDLNNPVLQQLEQRVAALEGLLSSLQSKPDNPPHPRDLSEYMVEEPSAVSAGLLKGRNYRTFYYGPTNPMLVVAHFSELRPFMKRIFINSTLARLRQDLKGLEERSRANKTFGRVLTIPNLRSLLPDRSIADKVINTYFETFETTYRILHAPTFWATYQSYWDITNPLQTTCLETDATVLAILACTLCISTHETTRYDSNGSTFRTKAILWMRACGAWLKRQSNKHEYYQEVQAFMAQMRSAGMHRDPSILGSRRSIFEGEMRRRLWATAMELELQASIDKGTPSILSGMEYDCKPPRNINDIDLYPEMKHLPASLPVSTFTSSSFLHCAMQSYALRVRLCSQANSLYSHRSFKDTLDDEKAVYVALNRLSTWTERQALQASTLLDLQLRQFLLILHTPNALDVQRRMDPNHRYSLLTGLEASATLIENHIKLMDTTNLALCCIRSDYLRAALLICHLTYHASIADDSVILRVAKSILDDTMENALRLLEERSMRPGRGNHQFWLLSAACSLVSIRLEPARTQILERQACDRVCKLLYRVLSLQDDTLEESLAHDVILDNAPASSSSETLHHQNVMDVSSFSLHNNSFANPAPLLELFGADEDSAWMLNDFWVHG